jgi:hypothetical protein
MVSGHVQRITVTIAMRQVHSVILNRKVKPESVRSMVLNHRALRLEILWHSISTHQPYARHCVGGWGHRDK